MLHITTVRKLKMDLSTIHDLILVTVHVINIIAVDVGIFDLDIEQL